MLRDNAIPESELKYVGDRVYPEDFQAHPEYHGVVMPWYLIGGEHQVKAEQIEDFEQVDDDTD